MDNFLDVIISIAMVALFLLPSLIKSVKEVNKKPQPRAHPRADVGTQKRREFLHKNESETPKQEEYFTYETMDDDFENKKENLDPGVLDVSQQIDNKTDGDGLLTFEEDEVLKGVVYSEILKRKF